VRPLIRLIGFVLLAFLVVLLIYLLLPPSSYQELLSPAPTPVPPPSVAFVDVNPYGANVRLEWEPEEWKIEKTFELAHAAGIHWVKQHVPWDSLQLEPGPSGYWDERLNKSTWDKYDLIVKLAAKYDLEVIVRLDRPPAWTRVDNLRPERPPDDISTYGDFVSDVVSHFKGQVHYYQIWNEPNIYPEWGTQAPDPAAYVRLLRTAYQRAKEADPSVIILSAPLAQTVENSTTNESDVNYLEGMYAAGAKPYFDILFANAYGFSFPPDDPPSPDRLNFQRVVLLRKIMEKNGDSDKPVWFNEFGWDAAPDNFPPEKLPWGRVTDQQQAQYTVDAIQFARSHWNWAGVFNIWYFRQNGDISPDQADYYFRMVDTGFTPRPLYKAVQNAATSWAPAPPGSFSITNPAVTFSGTWSPAINPAAVGKVVKSTTKPGDSLTINFRGGGLSLWILREPNAGQVYLTIDGKQASHVEEQIQGRSVLNMNGVGHEAPILVPITDGLGPGEHVLRLVVGSALGTEHGEATIAGFTVRPVDRFATLSRYGVAFGALFLAIAILFLIVRARTSRRS
jgi:hypothetical protein